MLWGVARDERDGGEVVALVAAGGGVIGVRLVVVWSCSVWFRSLGILVWFVFVFVLLMGGEE